MNNNLLSGSKIIWLLLALTAVVYVPGLFVPLMDNDSAHHAGIALHMYLTGNYAYLIDLGVPYLDKPHLLFWMSAFSFKVFGVTTFAYKFPSFLFSLLGVYSTFRLGELLYNRKTGVLAALILSTSCAFVLANNDVRMEAILTGSIVFSIWQLCEYISGRRFINLLLAAFGLALGFSTKGMIGVVIPAVAIFLHLVWLRKWDMIFHWKWLILVALFGVFISPVVYSYYLQYDLHPETTVRGANHISGVKFILWNQNIERMKGESHTQKQKDFFFFFHTFLWAFLPWSLLSAAAVFSRLKSAVTSGFKRPSELLTTGAVVFFMIFFSFSKFKLPHYLNCLFPLFAILLAGYLTGKEQDQKRLKLFWNIQLYSVILTVIVALVLNLWAFPVNNSFVAVILILTAVAWLGTLFLKTPLPYRTAAFTITGAIFIYASLNLNFYPQLLTYQAGNQLAFAAKDEKIDPRTVFNFVPGDYSFSYDFYTAWQHPEITIGDIKTRTGKKEGIWVLTSEEGKTLLETNNIKMGKIYANKDYRVSILKPRFLNPKTREQAITTTYLIKLF